MTQTLTRTQRRVLSYMRKGADLRTPYHDPVWGYLVSETPILRVRFSTVEKLEEMGLIEEIDPEEEGGGGWECPDVHWRLRKEGG